uniref:Uncharacterized protein n=1 Tax=Romanomermis culicivorax TaxID=13658 RepID=A0A915I846_ROMCU
SSIHANISNETKTIVEENIFHSIQDFSLKNYEGVDLKECRKCYPGKQQTSIACFLYLNIFAPKFKNDGNIESAIKMFAAIDRLAYLSNLAPIICMPPVGQISCDRSFTIPECRSGSKSESVNVSAPSQASTSTPSSPPAPPPLPRQHQILLPGVVGGGKESVFVRMNNRIKTLELNISLSGQYLSELSRKYRRQMEDIQRAFNATSRLFSETDRKFEQKLEEQAENLQNLRSKVEKLKIYAERTAEKYGQICDNSQILVCFVVAFFFGNFVVVIIFWHLFSRYQLRFAQNLEQIVEKCVEDRLKILKNDSNRNCAAISNGFLPKNLEESDEFQLVKKKKHKKKLTAAQNLDKTNLATKYGNFGSKSISNGLKVSNAYQILQSPDGKMVFS